MGIQAFISVADLEAACIQVVHEPEEWDDVDYEGNVSKVVFWQTLAVFPDGEQLWFNTTGSKERVWIDVNHWGNNRAKYLPVLDKYKVKYVEG
jgi:hypothetical protein